MAKDVLNRNPFLKKREQTTVNLEDSTHQSSRLELSKDFAYSQFATYILVSNMQMVSLTNGTHYIQKPLTTLFFIAISNGKVL